MNYDIALYDLIAPYVLRGAPIGPMHAALSVIRVRAFSSSIADEGIIVRGEARIGGEALAFFDPASGVFGVQASNTEGHPLNDSGQRDPWIDIRDTKIEFSLTAPREASAIIAAGVAPLNSVPETADIRTLLDALDAVPADAPPSDYPSTRFTMDMVITGAVLRPPFLKGAKLLPDGRLVDDPQNTDVSLTLPRFKLRLSQGSNIGDTLDLEMLSLGVAGLDDPGDMDAAELITMNPPYAFIGDSHTVGLGFRSAILDLSDGYTPPAILDQFGFDESWTGLYLPEIRLFVAPNGLEDFAVSAGVSHFLIGWGEQGGITGDFELAVIDQGSGDLKLSARFVDPQGRRYGMTSTGDTTAEASLPAQTRMVIDVQGGRPPYFVSADLGAGALPGRVFEINLGSDNRRSIHITARDSRTPVLEQSLTIQLTQNALTAPAASTTTARVRAAEITTQQTTREGVTVDQPSLVILSQSDETVTLALRPSASNTTWERDGSVALGSGPTQNLPLGTDETLTIEATIPGVTTSGPLDAYFHFDHPKPAEGQGYARNPANSHTTPAVDEPPQSGWLPNGQEVLQSYRPILDQLPNGSAITITGMASFEGAVPAPESRAKYNYLLSQRRALAFEELIKTVYPTKFTISREPPPISARDATPQGWIDGWELHRRDRNTWWKASATIPSITSPSTVTTATIHRPPTDAPQLPVPVPDAPPADPDTPSWFRSAKLKVRIVQNSFIALEIAGEIDFETAVEGQLREADVAEGDLPSFQGLGSQNPADGIVAYQLLVQIDDASQAWSVSANLGAAPADVDGLLMTGTLPGASLEAPSFGRNMLGVTTAMAPVLAAVAPSDPLNGDVGAIALSAVAVGLPAALAALGWINIERVILYGGEIVVRERTSGPELTFLCDVETAVSMNIQLGDFTLLEIPRESPLVLRYKAIGLKLGYTPPETRFQFRPMFDSSKGYTIEVAGPGGIRIPDPLGNILQVLGARLARTNPMSFEIDLGFSVDLGVVSVDRARIRLPLSPEGPPELTAFGASIDIPGALRGSGFLEINQVDNPDAPGQKQVEIKGGLDLTIVPVKLRISAQVGISDIPASQGGPATAVIVSLEVQLPVAIPLGASGLGIYGFMGLFAMHYARNEAPFANDPTPALAWLQATGGNPMDIRHWSPSINQWAFGVGALLGTMEGGIIMNLKGVFLLELPGPRILIMMKARLLTPPPALEGVEGVDAGLLAVIDLDFARHQLTIGIIASYEVKPLVRIRIPVEAFFNLKESSKWHVYLGSFENPIQASIFGVFEGSGYLMISGDGIANGPPSLPGISSGLAIATGLHVQFVWGNLEARIYARIAGGFDAVLRVDPFFVAGALYIRGELRLIILSISAYAKLTALIGELPDEGGKVSRITGQVCGEIDLFFFSIKGCVDFTMGTEAEAIAPPLVERVSLVSRSPALAIGTGADQPIDAVLADAIAADHPPSDDNALPTVPIDSIPSIVFTSPPGDQGLSVFGHTPGGHSGASASGWVKQGNNQFLYTLTTVTLDKPVGEGNKPAVWWTQQAPESDNFRVQLALLTWVPNPTPVAIERSEFLEETITDRWGTICHDAAPAAPVLWTFRHEALGPSETGWLLEGEVWPDPENSIRTEAADTQLEVTESWRSGIREVDQVRGIIPAAVEGRQVACDVRNNPDLPLTHIPDRILSTAASSADHFAAATGLARNIRPDMPQLTGHQILRKERRDAQRVINTMRGTKSNASLSALENTALSLSDVSRQLFVGKSLTRNQLLSAFNPDRIPDDLAAKAPQKYCASQVLAAPIFDEGTVVALGDRSKTKQILKSWEKAGFKPSPLQDAIKIHTGGIQQARILLSVFDNYLKKEQLVARLLDRNGDPLDIIPITLADRLPPKQIPEQWVDPAGPWLDDVTLVGKQLVNSSAFATMATKNTRFPLVLLELKARPKLDVVEIGLLAEDNDPRKKEGSRFRPFYVGVIELTRIGEIQREAYDTTTVERNREVVEQMMGLESGNYALLKADTRYGLTVAYNTKKRDKDGVESDLGERRKTFWFKTADAAPKRLGRYLLCSLPGEGEHHVFGAEVLRIIFSSNQVHNLFAEYGLELRVWVKASSFRQPELDNADEPALQYPFPINEKSLEFLPASVLTPFEEVLAEQLEETCIAVDEARVRHSAFNLPITLDPITDYIIDIESVPLGAAAGVKGTRVHRLSFSTSAFGTLDDFVERFQATRLHHRWIESGALQNVGSEFASRHPKGAELDEALIGAGLEPMPVPDSPRMILFWEQESLLVSPQPAAILIDASEPLWRYHDLPEKVTDTSTETPSERWELRPRLWLDVQQGGEGDDIVEQIVVAPGGQRALITLSNNARGKHLQLILKRHALKESWLDGAAASDSDYLILDTSLRSAPWEEE